MIEFIQAKSWLRGAVLCVLAVTPLAQQAPAQIKGATSPNVVDQSSDTTDIAVDAFYRARGDAPLWFSSRSTAAAQRLLTLLATADADGLPQDAAKVGSLLLAMRQAENGDASSILRADKMLSAAFVTYAQALQADPKVGVIYVNQELKPTLTPASLLLSTAANAPSLERFIAELRWMNPLYGQLRQALVNRPLLNDNELHVLSLDLQRARAIPRVRGRFVLVNTANQQLYMYEGDTVVGQMKIIAGRPTAQTPLMNGFLRYAIVNPYWNVPADLVARLAPNVIRQGSSYLQRQGYQVVSDFSDEAQVLDPTTIDWEAVARGHTRVQMRQLPGEANSMGRVKYMFPNSQGVWLHDTPTRKLFKQAVRLESAGCVRLEDAWKLGSWLFQRDFQPTSDEPEHRVDLPEPVPVFITYLTSVPSRTSVEFVADVYRRNLPPYRPGTRQTSKPIRVGD